MHKQFLLDSLQHEQRQVLNYITISKRFPLVESWWLDYALTTVVSAYRAYRDGVIDGREAYELYQQVTRVTAACAVALGNLDIEQRRVHRAQAINDQLRGWYQRGWIELADGELDLTAAGRKALIERGAA